ncbi:MAG: sulfurtransferase TusA family protein [Eubacteriales bacterium]|nr:sulfurtransferase TusA family protein [Eubacteriales bacterium]
MIDARGLSCPVPVVMVQQEVKKNAPAELVVMVDNRVAVENITRFARSQSYEVAVKDVDGEFELTLKK